jgi:mono/diheme cytochrome c family protein
MRHKISSLAVGAATAVLVVVLFVAACASAVPSTTSSTGASASSTPGDATLGEAIYLTGADLSGDPIPRSGGIGMMGSGGCVTCHGPDGEGGTISMVMGSYDVPDIRWSTISKPMRMNGETEPPYDPSTFARAVREGIGSDGDELESVMQRWQLTGPEVEGLIAYLKRL